LGVGDSTVSHSLNSDVLVVTDKGVQDKLTTNPPNHHKGTASCHQSLVIYSHSNSNDGMRHSVCQGKRWIAQAGDFSTCHYSSAPKKICFSGRIREYITVSVPLKLPMSCRPTAWLGGVRSFETRLRHGGGDKTNTSALGKH
jgi:hypothetical protein